jgi:hypothetical protein
MIEQTGGPSTHPEIGVDKPNGGGDDQQHGQGQSAPNFNQQENVFPSIDSAAYHGLDGEIVSTIAPHSEADRWSDPGWGDAARQYHAARGGRLLVVEIQPERLARFRQLLGDNTSLDRVWRELNERGDRPAPQATFDALLYELRTLGVAAFKNPSCRRRLADLSDLQLRELLAALIRTRARYPAITDELLIALDEIRR